MMRKGLETIWILLLLPVITLISCKSETRQPNFLFILVDDLGWADLGYTGSTFYETPNIDSLCHGSVQFTNAYSAGSVCSPSRASIMTGKHPARVNITDWIPGQNPGGRILEGPEDLNELPLEEVTIAEALHEEGYLTFFAGKWHLGDTSFFPEQQGFDENFGGHHMGQPPGGYYSPYKNPKLTDGPAGEYLTDRLTNESIKFIDRAGRKPFFLFLSYYTVHTPIQPCKKHIEYFNEKLESMASAEVKTRVEGDGITTLNHVNAAYASMVFAMDENVGRLIRVLKEKGIYENTVIIFTSDNGGLSTLDRNYSRFGPTSVAPLRGGKGWLYEGGIRVPLLIKPANFSNSPASSDYPVTGYDFYPTLLGMAGAKSTAEGFDGNDLSPILIGEDGSPQRPLMWHYPHYHGSGWTPGAAIRLGKWKLIRFYESDRLELYNLDEDISESHDLSVAYPEKTAELKEMLEWMQAETGAKLPTENRKVQSN